MSEIRPGKRFTGLYRQQPMCFQRSVLQAELHLYPHNGISQWEGLLNKDYSGLLHLKMFQTSDVWINHFRSYANCFIPVFSLYLIVISAQRLKDIIGAQRKVTSVTGNAFLVSYIPRFRQIEAHWDLSYLYQGKTKRVWMLALQMQRWFKIHCYANIPAKGL